MSSDKVGLAVLAQLGQPTFPTARDRDSVSSKGQILKTGIAALDEIKASPVRLGEVVEIVGGSRSGKTQLLHQIAAHAIADRNTNKSNVRVCWFDLNGGLDSLRLRQLVQYAARPQQQGIENSITNLSGLQVYYPENTQALCAALSKLPQYLRSPEGAQVDTIIIDSLGSFHYLDKQDTRSIKDKQAAGLSPLANELLLARVVSEILRSRRIVVYVSTCALFGEESLSASWPFPEAGVPSIPADFMPGMWRSLVRHTLLMYHVQQVEENRSNSRRAVISMARKPGANNQKFVVQAAGTIIIEKDRITQCELHMV